MATSTARDGSASKVRAPSAAAGMAGAEKAAQARQSTSRDQARMGGRVAITAGVGSASKVRAPSAAAGMAGAEKAAQARQSTSRDQARMRDRLAITAAI